MRLPEFNRNSFAYRLISFVLLIMVLLYSVINLIIYRVVSDLMVRNTRDFLSTLVNERVASFDGRLKSIATQGRVLGTLLEDKLVNGEKLKSYILTVLHDNPDLVSICVAPLPESSTGIEARVYIQNSLEDYTILPISLPSYQFRDWFQIAILNNKPHWGEPWFDEFGSHQLICSYSFPLRRDGNIVGVLRIDTAVKNMQNIELPSRLKDKAYAFIVSDTGTIITHPADSLVMNYSIFNLADEYNDNTLMTIGKKMIKGGSELVKVSGLSYFQNKWIYYAQLPSNRWSIAIVVDNSFLFADMKSLILINLAVSVLGFLVISGVIYSRTLKLNRPLKHIAEAAAKIGGGDFEAPLSDTGGIHEVEQLTAAVEQMKESLKQYIANLSDLTRENEKIQAEVMFASQVQKSLVPQNDESRTCQSGINFYGILKPAGAIGGDLYDYFLIDEHRCCFAIADVVGKGLVAAMTMTMVSTLLRTVSKYQDSPSEMLYALNTFLSGNALESNLITIMLGIIDTRDGKLWYSNCGHLPWYQRKTDHRLIKHDQTHSTALGIFPNITIEDQILRLDLGDQLILMTDGVTETVNEQGEFFGSKGIEACLKSLQNPAPDTTANALLNAVEQFAAKDRSRDDLTILVVEFSHPHQAGA